MLAEEFVPSIDYFLGKWQGIESSSIGENDNYRLLTGSVTARTVAAHAVSANYTRLRGYVVLKRKKPEEKTEISEIDAPPLSKELKKRWSYFIRKVYETDPLICPKCQGEMRIISFIDQPDVIQKILQHLGLWEDSHAPPEKSQRETELTFDPSYSQLA